MAISDNGSFNLGLANIASQESGPNAVANQANTAANTQVQQQQAQSTAMQNKLMAARMPLILSQLHDESVGAGDQSGVGGGQENPSGGGGSSGSPASVHERLQAAQDRSGSADDAILNPDAIAKGLRDKYFVAPYTPQEMQALQRAYLVDPQDQYGMGPKRVMAMIDMRKTTQTTNNQKESRDDFDGLRAVTDAPDGQAMSVLERTHPETYAAIKRKFQNQPDEERNEEDEARLFAAHTAGAVHQYTGREAKPDSAGIYRDTETGMAIPGVEQVGLSKEQYIKLAHEALTPSVDVPDGAGGSMKVTPWKAAQMQGAKNMSGPEDWVQMRASQMGLPGAASTISPQSAQKQESKKNTMTGVATATKQRAAAGTPTNGEAAPVKGVGTFRNAQGQPDQKLTDAIADTSYDFKPSQGGTTYTPGPFKTPPTWWTEAQQKQQTARAQLAKDSNDGIKAAQASLTMYQAAQDILAKGNYDGGAWNARLAQSAGKYLPVGWQAALGKAQSTGDYQELTKMLGTAALQSGKGIFAKMTQMEAKMIREELSPSTSMNPQAMKDMIQKGVNISQYAVDSSKRAAQYLRAGHGDAEQFPTWNQEHFPMETETKVKETPATTGAAAPPKYSDAQVKGYMAKHGLKDEAATRKALGM